MFFAAALAVAAASASMVFAQDVSFNPASLNQCANTTVTYNAPDGSYYAAVVPAVDACNSDPFAEFYDLTSGIINFIVTIPSGTQVQVYLADTNGDEYWSDVMTVGDGDASCLDPSSSSSSSDPSDPPTSSTPSTTTSSPSTYTAPANFATSSSETADDTTDDPTDDVSNAAVPTTTPDTDTPVNNASASGASSITVSFPLIGGAILAAAALL